MQEGGSFLAGYANILVFVGVAFLVSLFKNGGGSAGHKGVASIIQSIGHDFRRLRIGIGHPPPPLSVTDYVLEPFSPQEKEQWLEPLQHRVKTASLLLAQGEYDRFLGTVCVKVVGDS